MASGRYASVSRVLARVLVLNLAVAVAKVVFGYATGAASILSDGFHSLTDSFSNIVALVGVRASRKPADADHPYGHRKYETLATVGVFVFLVIVIFEVVRAAIDRLGSSEPPAVTAGSFAVMIVTLAVNVLVVRYERRAAQELGSEILLADSIHTQSDMLTSVTVIAALIGVRIGFPLLDPIAALVVAGFIGKAGFDIGRVASEILSDRIVIAENDLREVVLSAPGVLGCHHIRTRGSVDHVFLDLHIWLKPETRLDVAHEMSHVVKDRLMERYPQIVDAVIHIEPPPKDA